MKYSVFAKFVAILLCAAFLTVAFVGISGIILCQYQEVYDMTPEEWLADTLYWDGMCISRDQAEMYSIRHLGNCSPQVQEQLLNEYSLVIYGVDDWSVTLSLNGVTVSEAEYIPQDAHELTYTFSCWYPTVVESSRDEYESLPQVYYEQIMVIDELTGEPYEVNLLYRPSPEFTATVFCAT